MMIREYRRPSGNLPFAGWASEFVTIEQTAGCAVAGLAVSIYTGGRCSQLPGTALAAMPETPQHILDVYEVGETVVVGFGNRDVLDNINLSVCREQLVDLLKTNNSHTLGFDLTGVKIVPSGFLGLMASVRSLGVQVHLYNPSEDVREVLATTNLDKIMPIHEIDFSSRKPGDK